MFAVSYQFFFLLIVVLYHYKTVRVNYTVLLHVSVVRLKWRTYRVCSICIETHIFDANTTCVCGLIW